MATVFPTRKIKVTRILQSPLDVGRDELGRGMEGIVFLWHRMNTPMERIIFTMEPEDSIHPESGICSNDLIFTAFFY
jgi:hypothetical protein